jgi:hypothetical protein
LETKTLFLIPLSGAPVVLLVELEPHPASNAAMAPAKTPETYFFECIPRLNPAFCVENADYNRAGSPNWLAYHRVTRAYETAPQLLERGRCDFLATNLGHQPGR